MSESTADFSLSLLDMLCAAMGGVALIVFLFAAMRKNLEQQEEVGNILSFSLKITSSENIYLRVTKEIGFCIYDEVENEAAYIGEDMPNARFSIKPAGSSIGEGYASSTYKFMLSGNDIPDQVKIRVWLNDLTYDIGSQIKRLPANVKFSLFYNDEELVSGELSSNNDYIGVSQNFTLDL